MKLVKYLLMLFPIYLCVAFFDTRPSYFEDLILSLLWPCGAGIIALFFVVTALRMQVDHWKYNQIPMFPRAIAYHQDGDSGSVLVISRTAEHINYALSPKGFHMGWNWTGLDAVQNLGNGKWQITFHSNRNDYGHELYKYFGGE